MFGQSRKQENLLAEYKAIISDLRDQLLSREKLISELTDKVLALSAPAALREARRPPPPPPAPTPTSGKQSRRRVHWPGYQPDLRPPSPTSPPTSVHSPKPMSDGERIAAISQVEKPDGN